MGVKIFLGISRSKEENNNYLPIGKPVAFNLGMPLTNNPPRPPVVGASLTGLLLVVVRTAAALFVFEDDLADVLPENLLIKKINYNNSKSFDQQ